MPLKQDHRQGFSLLELLVVIAILALLLGLTLAAIQRARGAVYRTSCLSNMRQLGLALHQYHQQHHRFPPGVAHHRTPPGRPLLYQPPDLPYPMLSWHGRLTPYLERNDLWSEIERTYQLDPTGLLDLDHPASSVVVPVFLCPLETVQTTGTTSSRPVEAPTSYLGVEGVTNRRKDGLIYLDSQHTFAEILDGTSHTLLVGERPPDQVHAIGRWYGGWGIWSTLNTSLAVREENHLGPVCEDRRYPFQQGKLNDRCSVLHFWSHHSGGAHFLFADGSARFLTYSAASILPALATRDGGESVNSLD